MDAAPRAWVAQLVEQRIENPRVGGSNPPPGTIPEKSDKYRFPVSSREMIPVTANHQIVTICPSRLGFIVEVRAGGEKHPIALDGAGSLRQRKPKRFR